MNTTRARKRMTRCIPLLPFLALSLAACGGGGGGGAAGAGTPAPQNSRGVATGIAAMAAGSVTVNGISFAIPPGTPIRVDDLPASEAQLRDGMKVKVRGTVNTGGVTGTAQKIDAQDEIEGPVSSLTPGDGMFLVLGHTVFVDDLTAFANTSGLSGADPLAVDDSVEVHGFRDGSGNIRASRVERKAPGQEAFDVKGTVSGLAATTFSVGATVVTFDPAIAPPGLADGIPVEVKGVATGAASMTATAIEREDLEDADFEPRNGEVFSVGGFTSGYGWNEICVDGRRIETSDDTLFVNGAVDDLIDGIGVQATGRMAGTEPVADKISYLRTRIRMRATANAVDTAAQTVVLFTETVQINLLTQLGVQLAGIRQSEDRLEALGYKDAQGRLIAERLDPAGGDDDVLQGRLEDRILSNLVILNLTAQTFTSGSTATKFRDASGTLVTPSDFFAAVVPGSVAPPGTLVRVTGTFSGGIIPLVAKEVKEED